jgi:hypothetical protein
VYVIRVLRRIFGLMRDKVTGSWRSLYSEEFHDLYASPNIARVMRWAEHVACLGEMRNVYKILLGKPEGKRLLGRCRHRLWDNITMDLREIGWEDVDRMHVAHDTDQLWALGNNVMNLQVP